MLRLIAGPEHPAVDQPGRWRHLGQDGRRILLAGVVEDPGQELGPFPRRAPASLPVQERAPLRPGQVLFKEGKNLAFLMRQVIQQDSGLASRERERQGQLRTGARSTVC